MAETGGHCTRQPQCRQRPRSFPQQGRAAARGEVPILLLPLCNGHGKGLSKQHPSAAGRDSVTKRVSGCPRVASYTESCTQSCFSICSGNSQIAGMMLYKEATLGGPWQSSAAGSGLPALRSLETAL